MTTLKEEWYSKILIPKSCERLSCLENWSGKVTWLVNWTYIRRLDDASKFSERFMHVEFTSYIQGADAANNQFHCMYICTVPFTKSKIWGKRSSQ